jgi:1,4-alpha-glucan branching enzyme
VKAHRRRFGGGWRGGFWLPECAYAPWLDRPLQDAGASAACVELSGRFGLGASEHLQTYASETGLVLVPIDRSTISLVWSDDGYPASGVYRDYHHHTVHHHNPWSNDGGAYDHERALAQARDHAVDFVARTIARLRGAGSGLAGGGLAVCALDTELLGHWWYEGVAWLTAVVDQCTRQGLELVRLDDALERHQPAEVLDGEDWQACSWGSDGDLSTWSGPAVGEMAFVTRTAELELLAARERVGDAAVRELLALQASDWAFMVSRDIAAPYARERFAGHRDALATALATGAGASIERLGNLAVDADTASLRV